MSKEIIKYSLIIILTVFYIVYTIRFSLAFKKNVLLTGRLKTFHFFMFWIIPFIWILILKSVMKSTPGSYEFEDKKNLESFTESGIGIWADPPPDN